MKGNTIHIHIPKPCHESWDRMDATAQGAFCHSCQKEVIDFSAMTDREVIEYLEKHKTGCGRFRMDQIDTKLTIPEVKNGLFKWKALLLSVLSFISFRNVFTMGSPARVAFDQKEKDTASRTRIDTVRPNKTPINSHYMMVGEIAMIHTSMPIVKADTITVYGKVLDANKKGLANATIELLDSAGMPSAFQTTTDSTGDFSMIISPVPHQNTSLQLWILGGNYRPKTISLSHQAKQYVTVILNEPEGMKMGKMMLRH